MKLCTQASQAVGGTSYNKHVAALRQLKQLQEQHTELTNETNALKQLMTYLLLIQEASGIPVALQQVVHTKWFGHASQHWSSHNKCACAPCERQHAHAYYTHHAHLQSNMAHSRRNTRNRRGELYHLLTIALFLQRRLRRCREKIVCFCGIYRNHYKQVEFHNLVQEMHLDDQGSHFVTFGFDHLGMLILCNGYLCSAVFIKVTGYYTCCLLVTIMEA